MQSKRSLLKYCSLFVMPKYLKKNVCAQPYYYTQCVTLLIAKHQSVYFVENSRRLSSFFRDLLFVREKRAGYSGVVSWLCLHYWSTVWGWCIFINYSKLSFLSVWLSQGYHRFSSSLWLPLWCAQFIWNIHLLYIGISSSKRSKKN